MGAGQQDPGAVEAGHHQGQQLEGLGVGPVQVVEHDHDRLAGGGPADERAAMWSASWNDVPSSAPIRASTSAASAEQRPPAAPARPRADAASAAPRSTATARAPCRPRRSVPTPATSRGAGPRRRRRRGGRSCRCRPRRRSAPRPRSRRRRCRGRRAIACRSCWRPTSDGWAPASARRGRPGRAGGSWCRRRGARCGRGGGRHRQRRIVVEDLQLEALEVGTGVEAELLAQRGAGRRQRAHGVGLAPGAVLGQRQLAPEPLAQRLLGHRLLQPPDDGAVAARGPARPRSGPPRRRRGPPRGARSRPRPTSSPASPASAGPRHSARASSKRASANGDVAGLGGAAALLGQRLEAEHVDGVAVHPQQVAGRLRRQHPRRRARRPDRAPARAAGGRCSSAGCRGRPPAARRPRRARSGGRPARPVPPRARGGPARRAAAGRRARPATPSRRASNGPSRRKVSAAAAGWSTARSVLAPAGGRAPPCRAAYVASAPDGGGRRRRLDRAGTGQGVVEVVGRAGPGRRRARSARAPRRASVAAGAGVAAGPAGVGSGGVAPVAVVEVVGVGGGQQDGRAEGVGAVEDPAADVEHGPATGWARWAGRGRAKRPAARATLRASRAARRSRRGRTAWRQRSRATRRSAVTAGRADTIQRTVSADAARAAAQGARRAPGITRRRWSWPRSRALTGTRNGSAASPSKPAGARPPGRDRRARSARRGSVAMAPPCTAALDSRLTPGGRRRRPRSRIVTTGRLVLGAARVLGARRVAQRARLHRERAAAAACDHAR